MVTLSKLQEIFPNVEENILEQELNKIDQQSILEQELDKLEIVVWDKISPINGFSADIILQDNFYDFADAIYLINKNGTTVIIQPYDYQASGKTPMSEQRALNLGNNQKQNLATSTADGIVISMITEVVGED